MQAQFWHQRWAENDIGFHESQVNTLLARYFNGCLAQLSYPEAARVLVPLCGKSRDLIWLAQQGVDVVGVELSELAVVQFFNQLTAEFGGDYQVINIGSAEHASGLTLYQASALPVQIYCGDIFQLTPQLLQQYSGDIDLIYDRAALIALPDDAQNPMRSQYAQHLQRLSNGAPQLVITFDYDQRRMAGPPFAIGESILAHLYQRDYQLEVLEVLGVVTAATNANSAVRLNQLPELEEIAWWLSPRRKYVNNV